MHIRLAALADAPFISALNADVQKLHAGAVPHFFKPPSDESFPTWEVIEMLNNPNNVFFVVEIDGQPIGYLYAEIKSLPETASRYAQDYLYIHHISVRPQDQHHGYGEQLVQAAKDFARQKEIQTLALEVWDFNAKAQMFFARQGFMPRTHSLWLRLDS